eukprot:GHRQ01030470.1.p1 GENE.GHRQ01030470.1~~GHRQ01030470.1.p1  ORF type:complete len:202 (+),score=79.83 GHRQ01030470.1:90-695(+)
MRDILHQLSPIVPLTRLRSCLPPCATQCTQAGDYGKQRVWASIGWGAASLPAGWLISQAGIASGFVVFGLASVPLVFVASQLRYNYSSGAAAAPASVEQQQQQQAAVSAPAGADMPTAGPADAQQQQQIGMRQLLQQPAVLAFLWQCLLMGFGLGVMGTYEFLWLKQLGAPETLMGMALLVRRKRSRQRLADCVCRHGVLW